MAAVTDGESTPFGGGAKVGSVPRKPRKTASRTPPPSASRSTGPKRSSTVVMENPEIPPASPAPPFKPTRKKTSKSPPYKRKPSVKMTAVRQATEAQALQRGSTKPRAIEPAVGQVTPDLDDDDDDDDVPTRSKSMDWADPASLEGAGTGDPSTEPESDESPAPPSADETLVDLAPLTEEDFTFVSDDEEVDESDPDPMGHMPTHKEMPVVTEAQSVTLVNGVNTSQRKAAEVVRVTDKYLFVLDGDETRRIGRKAGFELPPGGAWSAWRLSGEDHKRWCRDKDKKK